MLLAIQRTEEASLKCQVLDEEIDCDGYIPTKPCTSDEIALRLDTDAMKSLLTKKLSLLSQLIQNSFAVDAELLQVNAKTTLANRFNPILSKPALSRPLSSQSDRPTTSKVVNSVQNPEFQSQSSL